MRVIVAVTHSCLLTRPDPGCDRNSLRFARRIRAGIPGSVLVQSRTRRAECDNNRRACRNTPMRRRLRELMRQRPFLVVDVHTFDWPLRVRGRWTRPEVALLDTRPRSGETRGLFRAIVGEGIRAIRVTGTTDNDVQLEARSFGGKAVLLEMYQGLSGDAVDRIARAVRSV